MASGEIGSVTGGWLGTYAYQGRYSWQPPMRFEATFTPVEDGFRGTILDDGDLGIADVVGSQSGRQVRFTKTYRVSNTGGADTAPVEYEGALSEDGRNLTGTWMIAARGAGRRVTRIRGVWDAHRLWGEEAEAEPESVPEAIGRELVMR